MTSVDFTKPSSRQLHRLLVEIYHREDRMEGLYRRAGLSPADIPVRDTMRETWQEALVRLDHALRLDAVLDAVLSDDRAASIHDDLRAFRVAAMELPVAVPASAGRGPLIEDERRAFEKIMGDQPTFLDIAFLQAGLDAARAVARLRLRFPDGWYTGTGFLVGPDVVLTNHHNLFTSDGARVASLEVLFDYETTSDGRMREPTPAAVMLDSIVGEAIGDWAICRLASPMRDRVPLRLGTKAVLPGDWVAIVQHPGGLPKKIALHHNTVTYADDDIVHYLTDTLGGSSGAPVFDERWTVVALHHAGGESTLPGTQTTVYRNQGIPSRKVRAALVATGVELLP
jgi:hypothetical protein